MSKEEELDVIRIKLWARVFGSCLEKGHHPSSARITAGEAVRELYDMIGK